MRGEGRGVGGGADRGEGRGERGGMAEVRGGAGLTVVRAEVREGGVTEMRGSGGVGR